jgi:hypothetical protein
MTMTTALAFNDVTFDIVDRNGTPWLKAGQVGQALGFVQPDAAISKLYKRNADEFTDEMTWTVNLVVQGQNRKTRIFSPRGCHLLAMFASTPKAKEFRRWVLDVLDGKVAPRRPSPLNDNTRGGKIAGLILAQTGSFRFSHIRRQFPSDYETRVSFVLYQLRDMGLIRRVDHGLYEVVGTAEASSPRPAENLEALFATQALGRAAKEAVLRFEEAFHNIQAMLGYTKDQRARLVL